MSILQANRDFIRYYQLCETAETIKTELEAAVKEKHEFYSNTLLKSGEKVLREAKWFMDSTTRLWVDPKTGSKFEFLIALQREFIRKHDFDETSNSNRGE